jgi:hypothetical protein
MSTIENQAEGDAIQFMVSTNGKTICGKNCGSGWRTRQVGGYMSDVSLQQLSQNILSNDQQKPVGKLCQRYSLFDPDKGSKNYIVSGLATSNQTPHATPQFTPSSASCLSEYGEPH